jgi:hypothetical protein
MKRTQLLSGGFQVEVVELTDQEKAQQLEFLNNPPPYFREEK